MDEKNNKIKDVEPIGIMEYAKYCYTYGSRAQQPFRTEPFERERLDKIYKNLNGNDPRVFRIWVNWKYKVNENGIYTRRIINPYTRDEIHIDDRTKCCIEYEKAIENVNNGDCDGVFIALDEKAIVEHYHFCIIRINNCDLYYSKLKVSKNEFSY